MSYAHCCADGTRVWCSGRLLWFKPDELGIALPTDGMFLFARSGQFGHRAIVKGHGDGVAYQIDRQSRLVKALGPTYGNYCVALQVDGTPVWQDSANTYRIGPTTYAIPSQHRGTGQGFLSLDNHGHPIWTDRQFVNPIVVGGQRLGYASADGTWTTGQALDGRAAFLAFDGVRLWLAGDSANSPIAPRVTQLHGGSCVVSRSVPAGWYASTTFTPYTPPVIVVPAPEPPADEDDDDMTDSEKKDLFARLTRMERAIADLQEDVDELLEDGAHTPPPAPPDTGTFQPPAMSEITWLHTDVSDWDQTSTITDVTIRQGPAADQGTVCFPHTKAGQWPPFDNGAGEGNVWVVGQVNDRWYAACAEWIKPGQTCKRFTAQIGPPSEDNWGIGPHTKKAPLASWSPKSGEWVGWMVSTRARDGKRSLNAQLEPVLERSQVFWTRWP